VKVLEEAAPPEVHGAGVLFALRSAQHAHQLAADGLRAHHLVLAHEELHGTVLVDAHEHRGAARGGVV
jgi:hypothetical protein